jgi:hypothetical protein
MKRIALLLAVLVAGSMAANAQTGIYNGVALSRAIDNSLPYDRVFVDVNGHGHISYATLQILQICVLLAKEARGVEITGWPSAERTEALDLVYIKPATAQRYLDEAKAERDAVRQ